jgi:hypothetical protein
LYLSEEDFDSLSLADDLVAGLHQLAAQKGTEVTVKPLGPLPRLLGDYFRISQIIQNFLTNALKFTENGQITIEIETQPRKDPMLDLEVRVIDTGIGIAEEDQERVFEPFVQAQGGCGVDGAPLSDFALCSLSRAPAVGAPAGVVDIPCWTTPRIRSPAAEHAPGWDRRRESPLQMFQESRGVSLPRLPIPLPVSEKALNLGLGIICYSLNPPFFLICEDGLLKSLHGRSVEEAEAFHAPGTWHWRRLTALDFRHGEIC